MDNLFSPSMAGKSSQSTDFNPPKERNNQTVVAPHPYQSELGPSTAVSGIASDDTQAPISQGVAQPAIERELASSVTTSSDEAIVTPTSSVEATCVSTSQDLYSTQAPEHAPSVAQLKSGIGEAPSESHALAADDHEHLGVAHTEHKEPGIDDLGWDEAHDQIPSPLIGRLPNEDLWVLIRRFNQQIYSVKSTRKAPPGGLDLVVADEEQFSPDKLTANIERLYVQVILGVIGFGKHIARLRSWNEKRRTTGFAAVYFLAWALNLVAPAFLLFLMILILYPPSRSFLFPNIPQSMISSKTGTIQKPKAGVLGSEDTLTGAQERLKGEAAEQEAHNFVTQLGAIAFSSATGEQSDPIEPANDGEESLATSQSAIPNPAALAASTTEASQAHGSKRHLRKHDRTRQPMEAMMWSKVRPLMHGVSEVIDTWERVANSLSPTPPFNPWSGRLKLASVIAPALAASVFVSHAMMVRSIYAILGLVFFTDPIQKQGIALLNQYYPQWPELFELRRTLFKSTPTNAQLTITLLRIGEANKKPLPPPPHTGEPPPDKHIQVSAEDIPIDGIEQEHVQEAIEGDGGREPGAGSDPAEMQQARAHKSKLLNKLDPRVNTKSLEHSESQTPAAQGLPPTKKKGGKIMGLLRGSAKYSTEAALGADRFKASLAGSKSSKNRLGVISDTHGIPRDSGPVSFKCRSGGQKGFIMIDNYAPTPLVYWSRDELIGDRGEGLGDADVPVGETEKGGLLKRNKDKTPKKEWELQINQIKELRKVGGLDWKAKAVVAWATEREVADGLEIVGTDGLCRKVTAVQLREELFNRLASMGPQKWEAW